MDGNENTGSGASDAKVVAFKRNPFHIEKLIRLEVEPLDDETFIIRTIGMRGLGKPELTMPVKEGYFLPAACRILNDTARYIVTKNKDVKNGQRVQLGPWTVVQFTRPDPDTIIVSNGSSVEFFQ